MNSAHDAWLLYLIEKLLFFSTVASQYLQHGSEYVLHDYEGGDPDGYRRTTPQRMSDAAHEIEAVLWILYDRGVIAANEYKGHHIVNVERRMADRMKGAGKVPRN